jgi:DNA-binding winged helix-turn-helix (wHTH) protein
VVIIQEWKIRFFDPDKTKGKSFSSPPIDIIKSPWVFTVHCDTLYKVKADQREAVKLTPSEKKMIAYMASKNFKENGYPVLCSYEELKQAIWGDDSNFYEDGVLQNIAKSIRKKLRLVENEDKHKWLGTQTGEGYILNIYCEK